MRRTAIIRLCRDCTQTVLTNGHAKPLLLICDVLRKSMLNTGEYTNHREKGFNISHYVARCAVDDKRSSGFYFALCCVLHTLLRAFLLEA